MQKKNKRVFKLKKYDRDDKYMLVGKISHTEEVNLEKLKTPHYMYRCWDPLAEDQSKDNLIKP